MSRVAVIGGGVIGLAAAYFLGRCGADVVVIDKGKVGAACSSGNLGWIVPSHAGPVPAPGLTLKSLRWLIRSDSPLYIKPAAIPSLFGWLWQFRGHCNARDHEAGFHAIAAFGQTAMPLLDQLVEDGVAFEMDEQGLLYLFRTQEAQNEVVQELRPLERYGYKPARTLSGAELKEFEPGVKNDLFGGVHLEGDRHVRPETLCAGLEAWVKKAGIEIREGVEIQDVMRSGERVAAFVSSDGRIEADAFVIAAGAWSGRLAQRCGYRLPVQAGKGYSITVRDPAVPLRHPLYLAEAKMGCTPYQGASRIAGTMELSGINQTLDRRRIAALERSVGRYLPRALEGKGRTDWVGMRPITPDGLPVIGRLPGRSNVYVATGHAMLGVTLALSTGSALAELVVEGRSEVDLSAFDPGRF